MISSPETMLTVVWNLHGFPMVKALPGDASGQSNVILIIVFLKSALFSFQEMEENWLLMPTMPGHMSQEESSSMWKSTA
jgi:hypothetical protein